MRSGAGEGVKRFQKTREKSGTLAGGLKWSSLRQSEKFEKNMYARTPVKFEMVRVAF